MGDDEQIIMPVAQPRGMDIVLGNDTSRLIVNLLTKTNAETQLKSLIVQVP
jgi:hypothetical protein